MKKEDMMKPLSAGKTGLKTERSNIKLLFFAVLFSSEIYSQIPINGFCRYYNFSVQPEMTQFLSINYNNDSYTDLFLYNPAEKKASVLKGESGSIFGGEIKLNLPFELSNVIPMFDNRSRVSGYAFTSRKNKTAGVLKFQKSGTPFIEKEIKFNAYPDNIISADVDGSGAVKLAVTGGAFEGISLLSSKSNFKLEFSAIEKNNLYPYTVFTELSNDGFIDIAAYNLIQNSIEFFYNSGRNRFSKVRTVKLDERISSLTSTDLNLDNYSDLILLQGSAIKVFYGDSASSYYKIRTFETTYHPDKVIHGDFNRDGRIDLAYLNKSEGIVSILFCRDEFNFHKEIIYFLEKGLKDITPFYSRFVSGMAALNENGKLIIISNPGSFTDGEDLVFSPRPGAINYFDYTNNGIYDLTFIDDYSKTLNFVTRDNAGIPQNFYSYNLHSIYSSIAVDDAHPNEKIFYCYTHGQKLIEVVKADFKNNKFSGNVIYSPGGIEDLKLKTEQGKNEAIVYVTYRSGSSAGAAYYLFKDFRYIVSDYPDAAENYETGSLTLMPKPTMYYWQFDGKDYSLSKFIIGKAGAQKESIFKLSSNEKYSLNSFSADLTGNETNITTAFFHNDINSFAHIIGSNGAKKINGSNLRKIIKINSPTQFYLGETRLGGIKKLNIYDEETTTLYRLDFIEEGRNFITTSLGEANGLKSYFIKNMNSRNYHIVYSNKVKNSITVKQVGK